MMKMEPTQTGPVFLLDLHFITQWYTQWPVWLLFDFRWDEQWRSICRRQWVGSRMRRRRRRWIESPRSACTKSPEEEKNTFSCVFVYFNLPCSVQESNSWWGCRQEWEAWRRNRGGCRTRPRWRWRCSAWSASPLRIVQANIKFNKTFV